MSASLCHGEFSEIESGLKRVIGEFPKGSVIAYRFGKNMQNEQMPVHVTVHLQPKVSKAIIEERIKGFFEDKGLRAHVLSEI